MGMPSMSLHIWQNMLVKPLFVFCDAYKHSQPGGATLMRQYAVSTQKNNDLKETRDASWAFGGGLNNHSRAARRQMRELRVAKVQL